MTQTSQQELIEELRGQLGSIDEQFTRIAGASETPRGELLPVFLAPEWHFRRDDRPYSAKEKDAFVAALAQLSAKFPDILFIPGSMVWTPGGRAVHNTAFVFFGGALVHACDKHHGVRLDSTWSCGTWTFETRPSEPFFEVRGVRFALEICLDHGKGYARAAAARLAEESGSAPNIDAHIVISAGATVRAKNLASDHEILVLSCDASSCLTETGYASSRGYWRDCKRLLFLHGEPERAKPCPWVPPKGGVTLRQCNGWTYGRPPDAPSGEFWAVRDEPLDLSTDP